MPNADKEALTIEPWAARIGLGTLAMVAGVAMFTAWDRTRTGGLEAASTPTAVGDTHFVKEPTGGTGPIGLRYQGRQLDVVVESKIRDSKLIRVGTDESGVFAIYRLEEGGSKERLFVKEAVNEFLEVRRE